MRIALLTVSLSTALMLAPGCGSGGGSDADRLGVGAQCTVTAECPEVEFDGTDAGVVQLECLTAFTGGYCGIPRCTASIDCPSGSVCVAHDNGTNYCFRVCANKPECNRNRDVAVESNCSSSFDWATPSDDQGEKACIPPSSGTP